MKRLIAALIGLLVLASGAGIAGHVLIDHSDLRNDVIAAVKRQTGRDLTMARFSIQILPWPSFSARDVTVSDLPQSGRPPMLVARDIRASIAVVPLLWREIRLENLTFLGGHVALDRSVEGDANWIFHAETGTSTSHASRTRPPTAHWKLEIGSAHLVAMTMDLNDRMKHRGGTFVIDRAEFDGLASPAPYLDVHGHRGQTPFRINGHIGPLSLLRGENPPWAISLGATIGPDSKTQDWLNFDGQVKDMRHFQGFSGILRGELASLSDLNALFPHAGLPALTSLGGEVGLYDADLKAGGPDWVFSRLGINHVHLHLGGAPALYGIRAGDVHIDADTLSSAFSVGLALNLHQRSFALQGTFGTLAQAGTVWQTRFETPLPVNADLRDGPGAEGGTGLRLHLEGMVGAGQSHMGFEGSANRLALHGAALHDVSLKGALDRDGTGVLHLSGVTLASHEAALTLETLIHRVAPSAVESTVHFSRLDLDALAGLWSRRNTSGSASVGQAGVPDILLPVPAGKREPSSPVSTSAGNTGSDNGIGHDFVPVWKRWLHEGHGKIDILADTIRFNTADYTDVAAHAVLDQGHLSVDSIRGTGNGMTLSGQASYDLTTDPARLSLSFSPFLFPASLAQHVLSLPPFFRGPLMLVGQIGALGNGRDAILRSMTGHLGLSMVGGAIESGSIGPYLGEQARVLLAHGELPVRCLGLHVRLAPNEAQIDTIGLEAGMLDLSGHGLYRPISRELDLHLLPRIGIGGTGASTPVVVTGTLDQPQVRQDTNANGRFEVTIGGDQPDMCPDILGIAREGVTGEAAPARKKRSQASELLHGLGLLH